MSELADLEAAHDASLGNRSSVLMVEACGCFRCLATFAPEAADEWVEERDGRQTALCPGCGVDSVLPLGEGVDEPFLRRMRDHDFY